MFKVQHSCSGQFYGCSVYNTVVPVNLSGVKETAQLYCAIQRMFTIQQRCSGEFSGCSAYSTIVPNSIESTGYSKFVRGSMADVQDTVHLNHKIYHSRSEQYSGCSGYSKNVPGSIPNVRDTKRLFRAVFWVFKINYSCFGHYSGCSERSTMVPGSIPCFRIQQGYSRFFKVWKRHLGHIVDGGLRNTTEYL